MTHKSWQNASDGPTGLYADCIKDWGPESLSASLGGRPMLCVLWHSQTSEAEASFLSSLLGRTAGGSQRFHSIRQGYKKLTGAISSQL